MDIKSGDHPRIYDAVELPAEPHIYFLMSLAHTLLKKAKNNEMREGRVGNVLAVNKPRLKASIKYLMLSTLIKSMLKVRAVVSEMVTSIPM